jgi:outer membrane protein assembly factor BamB
MQNQYVRSRGSQQDRRPGTFRASRSQVEGKWVGVIGPLTHDSCIFQDQRRLVCVDSITGEVRWWRSDIPPGCDLYGDEQYLFAVPQKSRQAIVINALDGRLLDESQVPGWLEQLGTIGRQVIRWRKLANNSQELSAVDALGGKVLWKQTFESKSQVDITQGRYVGVVEPSGHCTIIDAHSGDLLVDYSSDPIPTLYRARLLAGSDSFLLLAQRPLKSNSRRRISPPSPWDYEVLDGYVFQFDRSTGQPSWSRPAEVRQEVFILSQPVDLPVVAFAGNIRRQGSSESRQSVSLLLLDKASGRLLFHNDTLPQSANFCNLKVPDPAAREMVVQMTKKTIRLKFTDQPRPPEPPAIVGLDPAGQNGYSGLRGIFDKLMDGD